VQQTGGTLRRHRRRQNETGVAKTSCTLKYLARGAIPTRESKNALLAELSEVIPNSTVTALPVNQGYSIELEFTDIAPFNRTSFEPYIAEHVLREALNLRCQFSGALQLDLLKAHFG
tara:strand:+ start:127 stop:477 length:351 start_codon:yes stop_codon:yes gene_type:complete